MRVLFDAVDFSSTSGPNSFAVKLAKQLAMTGHTIADPDACDVQLSFIAMTQQRAPVALRLDGVYFNSAQEWEQMNVPLRQSMQSASAVVTQSEFDRELVSRYLDDRHPNVTVVHNGTDIAAVRATAPLQASQLDTYDEVWCCASSWRPHKRLSENVRYFRENAPRSACLVIAGANPDCQVADPRVFYAGDMDQQTLWGLYRRTADTSGKFIHLALTDHCPNVVVDARAAGCRIVCTDSGGTHEIAGSDATIVPDMVWDWQPFKLYEPPALDFKGVSAVVGRDSELDISVCAKRYIDVLQSVLGR